MTDALARAIGSVLAADTCSGCGACALISSRVEVGIDSSGFVRPHVVGEPENSETDAREAAEFDRACPGRRVPAPERSGRQRHPVLGDYVSVWEGWAVDPDTRFAGSSGGVLTALSGWLIDAGHVTSAVAAAGSSTQPTRTVPVRLTTKTEALAASGSRYAPVGVAAIAQFDGATAVVAKPCEVSAIRQLALARDAEQPVLLSFFCAGTPHQQATDELVAALGVAPSDATGVRYRGNGWPGQFTVGGRDGQPRSTSYERSWGEHLGPHVQWRCKVCADGMGDHADIAVGDFWGADGAGYPVFEDAPGRSVILARTPRGHELLTGAVAAGVLEIRPIDLDAVARVQPLQVERSSMVGARLAGRLLAGRAIPRYPGYPLLRRALRSPVRAVRSLVGTFRRSVRGGPDERS